MVNTGYSTAKLQKGKTIVRPSQRVGYDEDSLDLLRPSKSYREHGLCGRRAEYGHGSDRKYVYIRSVGVGLTFQRTKPI